MASDAGLLTLGRIRSPASEAKMPGFKAGKKEPPVERKVDKMDTFLPGGRVVRAGLPAVPVSRFGDDNGGTLPSP